MNKVSALRSCSVFGAMPFMLVAALASSAELRHRRHRAATRGMLVVVVAHAGIAWHVMRMLATPWRVRIAEPDSMHHVCMQVLFACSGACDSANLAVLYGTGVSVLCCSAAWAVPVGFQVKKYRFFFLIAIVRSITFLSGLPEAKLSNRSLRGENPGHKLTPFLPE